MTLKLPIVPRRVKQFDDTQPCIPDGALPIFYMSDYAVMGLVVSDLPATVRVLEARQFPLTVTSYGIDVAIDTAARVPAIVQELKKHGIESAMSDIVGHVYQG